MRHELCGAIVVALAFGACVTWMIVPPPLRSSAALLLSGVVFASFAEDLRALSSLPSDVVRRVQIAIAGAINVALLIMWRKQDMPGSSIRDAAMPFFRGGGGGDDDDKTDHAFDGFASEGGGAMAWIGTLPSSSTPPSSGAKKNRMGLPTDTADPEREKMLSEARVRTLRASARSAAMKTLQIKHDGASSAGSRLLFMPFVLGTAAIVPIVIASRFYGKHEGFAEEEDAEPTTRWRLAVSLVRAAAIVVLVAWAIARGYFVVGWALTIALLAVC
jgi:hypothetical protein